MVCGVQAVTMLQVLCGCAGKLLMYLIFIYTYICLLLSHLLLSFSLTTSLLMHWPFIIPSWIFSMILTSKFLWMNCFNGGIGMCIYLHAKTLITIVFSAVCSHVMVLRLTQQHSTVSLLRASMTVAVGNWGNWSPVIHDMGSALLSALIIVIDFHQAE